MECELTEEQAERYDEIVELAQAEVLRVDTSEPRYAAIVIDGSLELSDLNDTSFVSATVTISNKQSWDTLGFVANGATMGDIVERLKTLWGTYRERPVF